MDRVELHDVEYGDCTVLVGQNRQILMVDCGSVSRYARRGEEEIDRRFNEIFSRYTVPPPSASFCSRTTTATT